MPKQLTTAHVDAYLTNLPDGAIAGDMASTHTCVITRAMIALHPETNSGSCGFTTGDTNGPFGATYDFDPRITDYIRNLERWRDGEHELITKEEALALRGWA